MNGNELRTIIAHPFFALAREWQWSDGQLAAAKKLIDITVIRVEELAGKQEAGAGVPAPRETALYEALRWLTHIACGVGKAGGDPEPGEFEAAVEEAQRQLAAPPVGDAPPPDNDLEHALSSVLNRFSAENASNTPDYILAQYLLGCLAAWNIGVQQRETWYGRDARPTGGGVDAPTAPEPK